MARRVTEDLSEDVPASVLSVLVTYPYNCPSQEERDALLAELTSISAHDHQWQWGRCQTCSARFSCSMVKVYTEDERRAQLVKVWDSVRALWDYPCKPLNNEQQCAEWLTMILVAHQDLRATYAGRFNEGVPWVDILRSAGDRGDSWRILAYALKLGVARLDAMVNHCIPRLRLPPEHPLSEENARLDSGEDIAF